MTAHKGALAAVEQLLNEGGEADEVLRRVVALLHEQLGGFVRISFVEDGELVPGPAAGDVVEATAFPIVFQGRRVADLEAAAELTPDDRTLLERVATQLAPYALVGWDTGGEEWTP
jgi:hypothetical protein